MFVKIHKSYRNVVAMCDSNIIGKKFEEGIRQLDVRENFYKGEEIDFQAALKILESESLEDSTFNIVGEESVNTALQSGIITKDGISHVQGIPFALALV